ncbi:MAG: hypothetical protein PHI12_08920 [Dehalococcoidales bacterium]|nr:hypothetical protein [Dehalococcoidales bacterium]
MNCGDEIVITDARLGPANIFGGYIKDITYRFLTYNTYVQICKCQDYTKLITDVSSGVTADYSAGANTEKEILTALFAAHCATITVGASVIAGDLAAIKFTDSSLIRAIDELAAISDRKWYVDYDKALHYFVSGDEASTFDLSDSPNNTTTFPYANLEYTIDEDSLERATLVCWQPGLFAGQTIGITNATLVWADKQFLVTNVITKLKGKTDVAAYTLEYSVTLGTIPKQRFTNEVIRAGRVITTARVADAAITTAKIEDLACTTAKINDLAVTTAKIDSLAVTEAKIGSLAVTSAKINDCAVSKLTAGTISSKAITLAVAAGTGDSYIAAGKTDFTNTDSGFILGLDDSDSDLAKFYIGSSTNYLNWTGSALNITLGSGVFALTSTGAKVTGNGTSSMSFKYDSGDANDTGYICSLSSDIIQFGIHQELQITAGFSFAAEGEANIKIGVGAANYIEIGASYVGLQVYGLKASNLIEAQAGIASTGDIYPTATNTYDLGTAAKTWENIYGRCHILYGVAQAIAGCLFYDTDPSIGIYVNGGWHWKHLDDD